MKAILMSIQPQWVEKILNGDKTIEIRKTVPKRELSIDVYIYCTKGRTLYRSAFCNKIFYVAHDRDNTDKTRGASLAKNGHTVFNRKVVAKFTLKEVFDIPCVKTYFDGELVSVRHKIDAFDAVKIGTDSNPDHFLLDYSNWKSGTGHLYGWHISDLVIFNKPMELKDFTNCMKWKGNQLLWKKRPLTRPPQSYQYVEVNT